MKNSCTCPRLDAMSLPAPYQVNWRVWRWGVSVGMVCLGCRLKWNTLKGRAMGFRRITAQEIATHKISRIT